MADNSGPLRLFWPEIDDPESATAASRLGVFAASLYALWMAGLVTYAWYSGNVSAAFDSSGYLDAGVFAVLAFGIWRMWRSAAVAACVLYVLAQVLASLRAHSAVLSIVSVALALFFVSGIRGTFLFHKLSGETIASASTDE